MERPPLLRGVGGLQMIRQGLVVDRQILFQPGVGDYRDANRTPPVQGADRDPPTIMDGVHGILDSGYLPVHAHRPATSHAGERDLFAQVFDDAPRHAVSLIILRLPPFMPPVDVVQFPLHVRA